MGNKLLFVAPNARSLLYRGDDSFAGGAERQLILIARELIKKGVDVEFICKKSEGNNSQKIYDFAISQVRFRYLGGNKLFWFVDGYQLLKAIYKSKSNYIILRAGGHLIASLLLISKRLFNKKLIIWIQNDHDVDFELKYSEQTTGEGIIVRAFYKYCLIKTDILICQTKNQQKKIKKFLKRDSIVIPNFAGKLNVHKESEVNAFINKLPDQFILWAGNTSEAKRHELLYELASRMTEKQFVVCMYNNNNECYLNAKLLLERLDNVWFLGSISHEVMEKVFPKATILLNTSSHEGFPNTFLQAWINGVPVVSFGIDPDGIIQKHRLGIVKKIDQNNLSGLDDLILGIHEIFNDQRKYALLRQNCYKYIHLYHNPEIQINKLLNVVNFKSYG